jgi:ligand-binding SRPBCC domain-containing protein
MRDAESELEPVIERIDGGWILRAAQVIPMRRDVLFPFFADARNLARITPPELGFDILTAGPIAMGPGTLIDYRIRLWGVPLRWRTVIARWDPPHAFVDEQLRGPYAEWVHSHRFIERDDGTLMEDEVRFRLPFGALGALGAPLVRRQLRRIFAYRRSAIVALMKAEWTRSRPGVDSGSTPG